MERGAVVLGARKGGIEGFVMTVPFNWRMVRLGQKKVTVAAGAAEDQPRKQRPPVTRSLVPSATFQGPPHGLNNRSHARGFCEPISHAARPFCVSHRDPFEPCYLDAP